MDSKKEINFQNSEKSKAIILLIVEALAIMIPFFLFILLFSLYSIEKSKLENVRKQIQSHKVLIENNGMQYLEELENKLNSEDFPKRQIEIPKDWTKFENEYISVYYPADKFTVNENYSPENGVKFSSIGDYQLTFLDIMPLPSNFDYEARESYNRLFRIFYGNASGQAYMSDILYINDSLTYRLGLKFYKNVSPLTTIPQGELEMVKKGKINNNIMVISARILSYDDVEETQKIYDTIVASIVDKKAFPENPSEVMLGHRPPKNNEEEKELKNKFSDLEKYGTIIGNTQSNKVIYYVMDAADMDSIYTYTLMKDLLGDYKIVLLLNQNSWTNAPAFTVPNYVTACMSKEGKTKEFLDKIATDRFDLSTDRYTTVAQSMIDKEKISACYYKDMSVRNNIRDLNSLMGEIFNVNDGVPYSVGFVGDEYYGGYYGSKGFLELLSTLE